MSLPLLQFPRHFRTFTPTTPPAIAFGGWDRLGEKKVLIGTDVDDTLIAWQNKTPQGVPVGLADTLRYLQKNREHLFLVLNTGRGLASMKELIGSIRKLPKQLLENLPLQSLILNNGQMIFHNTRKQSLLEWVPTLTLAKQDKTWQRALEHVTGWNLPTVTSTIHTEILKAGFAEQPPNPAQPSVKKIYVKTSSQKPPITLQCFPDQPAFRLASTTPDPTLAELKAAEGIAQGVEKELKRKGWTVEAKQTSFAVTTPQGGQPLNQNVYLFKPTPINKGVALQYVLKRLEAKEKTPIAAVIPAGDDDYNDSELLTHAYQNQLGKRLPSLPIMSGTRTGLARLMANVQEPVQVPTGQLAGGFKAQLRKLLQEKKQ